MDEIIQVYVDGRSEILARTGTACGADFWAQPQQSPSADGSRILFSSNGGAAPPGLFGGRSSGTIDLFILYRRP
ncbi:MAG: hypothetical protein BWZ10_01138 [candidate division BRC1 bacterium ADurb.BinA364]|nr:MAG: hypothetical protein BWZ10_01138 [candidate division BRC1 bacterium ADurb.BinA364]